MDHEAAYYQRLENHQVRCQLCPHGCLIAEGKVGLCRVRRNQGGRLLALTYAQVASAGIDPIEKKPLYHYYPGAATFSLGTVGCNLHCVHCQNWQISQTGLEPDLSLQPLSPQELVSRAQAASVEILVFTYNEPGIWIEYILDCAVLAVPAGLKLVLVTNGVLNPAPLQDLLAVVDAYRVDLKGFSEDFYKQLTGFKVLSRVLDNTRSAFRKGVHVELVTNLIPGWNDDPAQLKGLTEWIAGELSPEVPWHVTRYHPAHRLQVTMTPQDRLDVAAQIGQAAGLQHVYVGNVPGHAAQDTLCAGCGALLIKRRGVALRENRLQDGCCPDCQRPLGVYRDGGC